VAHAVRLRRPVIQAAEKPTLGVASAEATRERTDERTAVSALVLDCMGMTAVYGPPADHAELVKLAGHAHDLAEPFDTADSRVDPEAPTEDAASPAEARLRLRPSNAALRDQVVSCRGSRANLRNVDLIAVRGSPPDRDQVHRVPN
jgi:hypothetical protein